MGDLLKVSNYILWYSLLNFKTFPFLQQSPIFHLKEKVEMQKGTPAFQQRLFTSGRTLVDEKKVDDYKLGDNDLIHMKTALRGD